MSFEVTMYVWAFPFDSLLEITSGNGSDVRVAVE